MGLDRLKHPTYEYIATTTGGTMKKRVVIKFSELGTSFNKQNCFRTWCRFEKDIIDYQTQNEGSLRGFNSSCYSDYLPIDIDNKNKPERSLITCKELIQYLEHEHSVIVKSLRIYFSGSKGFHLEIPTILFGDIVPSEDLPKRFKNIVLKFGFEDIDSKIYYKNCLWRLSNSINSKSGLYKIPITYDELTTLSYDKIKELANEPRYDFSFTSWNDWDTVDSLSVLWEDSKPMDKPKTNCPKHKQTKGIINFNYQGAVEGERNESAFKIAIQMKDEGRKINEAKDYIVNDWNLTCKPPVKNIHVLKKTVESAYSYNHYDSGSIGICKHLRTDPYHNSLDHQQKCIYVRLLSTLNEKDKLAFNKYPVKPNQRIFSYRKLAAEVDVSEQKVKTLIKKLKDWGRVTVETIKDQKGMDNCSIITFLCIDLTQFLTHQSPLENRLQLTQSLTTTNIKNNEIK